MTTPFEETDSIQWHRDCWPSAAELGEDTEYPATRAALLEAESITALEIKEPFADDGELCLGLWLTTDKGVKVRIAVLYVDGYFWYSAEHNLTPKKGKEVLAYLKQRM